MYGVLVGKAREAIGVGGLLTTSNMRHATDSYDEHHQRRAEWPVPDVSKWQERTFMGFHRADGSVGTANYWLVIPLVFCENRNIQVLEEALVNDLATPAARATSPKPRS